MRWVRTLDFPRPFGIAASFLLTSLGFDRVAPGAEA
jgi:hypothetical protein